MKKSHFFISKGRNVKIISIVLIVVALSLSYYIYNLRAGHSSVPYVVPALSKPYTNSKYHFSLMLPDDFTVRESSMDGKDMIVFQNSKSEGIQITISPYDDIKVLTADMIEKELPDMKVSDAEPVEIGMYNKGVAFRSNNDAFDGASREVWFVFDSKLYQISTYERFDKLLQKMFETWRFTL